MLRIVLFIAIIGLATFLGIQNTLFLQGFAVLMSCLTILWIISLVLEDSSIIDIFWGLGFIIVAWYYRQQLALSDIRSLLICLLITIWGLRLSLHLAIRNIGKGEDYRYQTWRTQYNKNWWWVSFLRVFLLQGILLWIISSVYLPAMQATTNLSLIDYIGIAIWVIGFYFEAVGDWQLVQFKKNNNNKGLVLDKGLWSLTRHPNYFGDALLWWGYFIFAINSSTLVFIFSPLLMTFLLMKVSGVSLLEQKLNETKANYHEYMNKVPAFFPRFNQK
ncbi:protein of unknown function DUF1295 [Emticicia oligotrophica DSM 17448]|uniref:DUF1295 domain-containing protein n=1 Tax=Emticicia oligotrophica (strain DSM 17448 / CIP 109782 / MTCC 6937 / GPTSA100-15) TaxID=929562 RepID=A0ABN4AUR1_EMTOG|nr:DUF1295 domain-containing protein [Emticicia oligotrophica]AFK05371.1 protein of unknown function DUF1295 [Emticicia oligotrophica DSM 17448]